MGISAWLLLAIIGVGFMAWVWKSKGDPWEAMIRQDVTGYCAKCRHRGQATLTAFRNKHVEIRCKNCNSAEAFVVDTANFDDPNLFKPGQGEDDESPPDQGSGRYTKGKR